MKEETRKIIEKFAAENRQLWGDKFFIEIKGDKVVLMTERLVAKLAELVGEAPELIITSLDKDESVGEWFRVKKEETSHIHHYHRDSKETDRLLQNLPSKDMMTVEEEDGRVVTKNELMSGELFRGVQIGDWIAAAVYHDFVDIAHKVIGWIKLDDRVERIEKKEFTRPENLLALDDVVTDLIGLPYHLGGKSMKTGFDCSSMVQWIIYHTKGIWMPKTSKWQALVGKVVSHSEIEKGDLIFFEEAPDWTIEHVGLFLGDDKMFHAYSDKKRIVAEAHLAILESRPGTIRVSKYTRVTL